MQCPNCGSENVNIQMMEKGQQTTKKGVGFGGHMNNAARTATAVCTLGVSNLFWKKSHGTNKTKTVTAKVGVCQNCGHSWEMEDGKLGKAPTSILR